MNANFWRGRHVIITGASSGIGAALGYGLASAGAAVGLIARRGELLEQAVERIRGRGGRSACVAADVRDAGATRAAVWALEAELGPCDVVIANAGIHRYTPADRFDPQAADEIFATNVGGVVHTLAAVLPGMVQRRQGHIAAVASIAGMIGLPEVGAYSASKAAVITLLESLRLDLHPLGIRVTTLCPGFVDTPLVANHDRRVLRFVLTVEQAAERIARAIEQGRTEYWFPWQTWLMARIARLLPFWLYRRACATLPRRSEQRPAGE